jgi:competence CoiA-like predicted nuclease
MLVAIEKSSGNRVSSMEYKTGHSIRTKFSFGELICPFCEDVVFARERKGFVMHFVHRCPCTSTIDHHPESPEHEHGKWKLVEFLEQEIKDSPSKSTIQIEYPLPQCGSNGRIADVALVYDNGNLLICECQLSKITTDELERRTLDYQKIGADVLWFLGGEADTPNNRTWLRSMFGSVGRLNFIYENE